MIDEKTLSTESAVCPVPGSFWKKPCFWIGLAIFLAAFAIRFTYVNEYTDKIGIEYHRFDQTDNHTFHLWAQKIAEGDWLCRNPVHPHHKWTDSVAPEVQWREWYHDGKIYHQAPLYPYMVGAVYYLLGTNTYNIKVLQAMLGALTCLLVFMTARLLFGRNVALVAACILVFSGFHFYYDAFILREGLVTLTTIAFLYTAVLAIQRRGLLYFGLAGFVLGLGIAAKPNAQALVPFFLAAPMFLYREESLRRRCLRTALFAVALLAPLLPLYARNVMVDCPTFKISTRGPTAFINGNLRDQAGTDWSPPPKETRAILVNANYKLTGTVKETLMTYLDRPGAYLELLCKKAQAFFNSFEIPNNTNYYLISCVSTTLQIACFPYGWLAPAALLGMLLLLPRLSRLWPLYLVTVMLSLVTIAFFIVARFRQPLVPLLAIFAGYSVIWFLKKLRGRRWFALLPALAAFMVLFSWTRHEEQTYDTNLSAYTGVMLKLLGQQEIEKAAEYKNKVIATFREDMEYRFYPIRQGRIEKLEEAFEVLMKAGRYEEHDARLHAGFCEAYCLLLELTKRFQFEDFAAYTRESGEKALALDPGIAGVHGTLGKCMVKQAEREPASHEKIKLLTDAFLHFKAESELQPGEPEPHKALGFLYHVFGQPDAAIKEYKIYLKLTDEWDYDIQSQLGRILMAQPGADDRTLAEGLAMVEDSYRFDPMDVRFCRNYSDGLYICGRVDEAIKILESMIQIDPVSTEVYQNRIKHFQQYQVLQEEKRKAAEQASDEE